MSPVLQQEVEIINSIYEDSIDYESSTSNMSLHVPESIVKIRLWFPMQYPEEPPRVSTVSGTSDNDAAARELNNTIKRTFTPGEVYLFTFLDEIKAVLDPLEYVEPPSPELSADESGGSERISEWAVADEITDRRSTFVARAIAASSEAEVADLIADLLQDKKVAKATHNVVAWRIRLDAAGTQFAQDFDDDGEPGAGMCMLQVLQMTHTDNVVVMVSRYFGGILLGPDRFKHFKNCTRDALVEGSFINK